MLKQQNRPTILLVDDQEIIVEFVELLLTDEGYVVVTARNGQEALQLIQTARPDLVITDFAMPGLDGWQLLQALRALPFADRLPVIIMSANRLFPYSASELGPRTAFLAKPFSIDDLLRLIEHFLGSDAR